MPESSVPKAESPIPRIPATREPDPLHRTMQFTLPPLPPRPVSPASSPQGPGLPAPATPVGSHREFRRWNFWRIASAAALLLVLLGAAAYWDVFHMAVPPQADTPVGIWETTLGEPGLGGAGSRRTELRLVFGNDGGGQFSWRKTGTASVDNSMPLHWQRTSEGSLTLALAPPPNADTVSGTLAALFNSHPWAWHVDRSTHRLFLGKLIWTEAV